MPTNLERMIALAEDVFDVRNDPSQLAITPEVMDLLRRLHHATLREESTPDGPIAWMIVIPTSRDTMRRFLAGELDEPELLDCAVREVSCEAVYLCSALVLPEYRKKGIARRMVLDSIAEIGRDHRIRDLYVWPFSKEGDLLAVSISRACGLPLSKRQSR